MDWTVVALVGSFVGAAGAVASAGVAIKKEKLLLSVPEEEAGKALAAGEGTPHKFDVFLSYAREDSDAMARRLAAALRAKDLDVWIGPENPEASISVADIAASSRYGLVILSPSLLADTQAKVELESLAAGGGMAPTILQIESGIDISTVRTRAPGFKVNFRINADELTPDDLVDQVTAIITSSRRG